MTIIASLGRFFDFCLSLEVGERRESFSCLWEGRVAMLRANNSAGNSSEGSWQGWEEGSSTERCAWSPARGNTGKGGTFPGKSAGGSLQELTVKKTAVAAWHWKGSGRGKTFWNSLQSKDMQEGTYSHLKGISDYAPTHFSFMVPKTKAPCFLVPDST